MANPNEHSPDKGNNKSNRVDDPSGAGKSRQQEQGTERNRDQKPQQGGGKEQNQHRRDQQR